MSKNRNPTRFWNYEEGSEGQPAVLRLDGVIAAESWWGDEVTPAMFRQELEAHPGDIEVYINSPGGDVFAGSQIYTMLMEHKGNVTVKIEGIACSAASVIAMAGTRVLIAPTAYMMIHCAASWPYGNKHELRHEADVLDEIDKGIREAYHLKTGIRDSKLAEMMDDETWLSSRTALELGFVDGIMSRDDRVHDEDPDEDDDTQVAEPGEGEQEEEEEEEENRLTALLTHVPAVAWSSRRQIVALRQRLRDEEHFASANHESLRELLGNPPEDKRNEEREQAEAAAAAELARRRLQLLTI